MRRKPSPPLEEDEEQEDNPLLGLFREELRGNAGTLTQGLLALEGAPADAERLEPLMRAAHSIIGAARIVGAEQAVRLARAVEDSLGAAHQGATLTPTDLDLLLRGADMLAALAELGGVTWPEDRQEEVDEVVGRLQGTTQVQVYRAESPAQRLPVGPVEPAEAELPALPGPTLSPLSPSGGRGAGGEGGHAPGVALPPAPPETACVRAEAEEAVVRVTAGSLNRLMNLAGESLVQARWLQPFATSLLKLKKQQDHLAGLLDGLAQALAGERGTDQAAALLAEARRQAGKCRQTLSDRTHEFEEHAARAEDLNSRLYREVIASRMRPFADGIHGFPRLARDMARRLGKQVELEVVGENTEVDRDILERLEAPLNHLVRNAIDHGIEPPEVRRAAGKPEEGFVCIEARHQAGMLAITVSDDGAGIDPLRLRHKVVEKGLTTAEMAQGMSEQELLEFLFLPGFSTASAVTEFSGRGVGLDVVQDTIRRVGGNVRISTRPGQGTSFHLKLPITLSVLRAVLVDIAGEPYAFPHNRIDRLLRVPRSELRSLEHRQFVQVDGQNIGLVVAGQMFDLPSGGPPATDELPVLLLSDSTGQYGLIVESFRGEQDLVVRPLDPRLGKVPNVSAAAILDDGIPVLIVDTEDLVRSMDVFIHTGALLRCERKRPGQKKARRVLVVDDSITVRELERQILRGRGYDVTVAVDGQEGWNTLQGSAPFDLLVTDIDMPRMGGLELVRLVRADAGLHDLPVVVVSYKDREEDRLRGLDVGANYYLTKSSFHDQTFLQAVVDLIGEA